MVFTNLARKAPELARHPEIGRGQAAICYCFEGLARSGNSSFWRPESFDCAR
jgi:hypothetical protein